MDFFVAVFEEVPGLIQVTVLESGAKPKIEFFTEPLAAARYAEEQASPRRSVFFGVSTRARKGKGAREDFRAAGCLWVDLDHDGKIEFPLPPSIVVESGTPGHRHLYWLLDRPVEDPDALQEALGELGEAVGGDSQSRDVVRLLRVPGTWNPKADARCELVELHAERRYSLTDLVACARLDSGTLRLVAAKGKGRFASRSEKDFAVITRLISAGVSDEAIKAIFIHNPCGEKYREEGSNADHYLSHSIRNARREVSDNGALRVHVVNRGGLWIDGKLVSNTEFHPKSVVRLEDGREGVLVVLRSPMRELEHFFRPGDLDEPRGLRQSLARAAEVTWIGSGRDLQLLKTFLTQPRVPRIFGAGFVGRWDGDEPYWIALDSIYNSRGEVKDPPVRMVNDLVRNTFPISRLAFGNAEELKDIVQLLVRLNQKHIILPILGWFMAAPYKPVLSKMGWRFPILNVWGTRGSGKTSLIQVFQLLAGFQQPVHTDIVTTPFIRMQRAAASSSVPLHLAEFRTNLPNGLLAVIVHDLLLQYDEGVDARGRPDLTAVEYVRRTPIVVDGEEPLREPALRERSIQVRLSPDAVVPASEHFEAYALLRQAKDAPDLRGFSGPYVLWTLRTSPPIEDAVDLVHSIPGVLTLADRVRRNVEVVVCGILSFHNFCLAELGVEVIDLGDVRGFVRMNIAESAGTRRLHVDDFVEDLLYLYWSGGLPMGKLEQREDGTVLWFHLGSAFRAWSKFSQQSRRGVLDLDALQQQLVERSGPTGYVLIEEQSVGRYHGLKVYGVVLRKAKQLGLDIPEVIESALV